VKSCPICRRLYADDAGFCPVDGVALMAAADVAPERDPDDPRVGQHVADRYQVRRIVADGGMGRVYEALDLQVGRRVALKVLHSDVARDKVALERFKREYEISQLLPHEHIVEVYDFLKLADGTYALAMDFLEGEELRALLKRDKTVRPARLVRMLSQIAIGLDEAHRRQLIHRDIKPDNVYLCGTHEGDVVKLLDFGSVKDKSEGAKKLTVMGTTIGSPFYMSPEQAQGLDTLDARADVWALAAISYESLTRKVPFSGNNGPSILLAILTQDPVRASQVAREQDVPYPVPPTVDAVLTEAFAKDPSKRVATVGLLADRLGHAYGLEGSHRDWAYAVEELLQESIDVALPDLMRTKTVRGVEEADPFATVEADPFATTAMGGGVGGSVGHDKEGMSTGELQAVLAPKGPPVLLILGLVVGLAILFAAGVLVVFVLL
jgi:serine/threonine-protein kinase